MSAELAHWLSEHQITLLPRWQATMSSVFAGNGYHTTPPASDVLDDTSIMTHNLEQVYAGFVHAADGDHTLLDSHLQAMGTLGSIAPISLPDLLSGLCRFRRLVWEGFQEEEKDPQHTFRLMHDLETLLDHTTGTLTRAWLDSTEMAIARSKEEAEFIAESMNTAMEQVDRTAVQLSLLNDLSQRLSSSLEGSNPTYIIDVVGSKLMDILGVTHISIWLPDEQRQLETSEVVLYAVQTWGSEVRTIKDMRLTARIDESWPNDIIIQAYMMAQVVSVLEPSSVNPQGNWYNPDCSVIALPLLVKDRATGVVVLQDANADDHFSTVQQDTLFAVVNQAAIALDNARLYAKVRRFNSDLEQLVARRTSELEAEKERLRTLHEIAAEVSSTLDLNTLLHTSLEALARITKVQFGSIMLVDQETDHLVNQAVLGQDVINTFTRFPIGQGVAGWVAHHKTAAMIDDVTADERWVTLPITETENLTKKNQGSMVAVPLIAHNETLGVLTLSHNDVGYFNEDHLRLLTASAGAIAIGIHNANLYNTIFAEMEYRSELLRNQQVETSKIEAILQSLADGVLVCDLDGAVLSANTACAHILHISVEELVLSNLHTLLERLLGRRTHELPLNDLINRPFGSDNQPRIFESTIELDMRIVSLTLGPVLKEDEELIGALLVLHDKTREVESDRLKTEFIGTMSHELRTPMTSIKGFTQLLVMGSLGPVNDTQQEFLNTIQNNAEHMITMINDVLELTKIETGSIDLEIRPLHLAEALSGVVSELQSQADKREHRLTITIPPGLPLVRADARRLHQILYNLIANAIKYTPNGGAIDVEAYAAVLDDLPQQVRDQVATGRRYMRIDVRDTGVGISEAEQEKVFDRFYRTENPLKIEAGGTGLGLSLTRPLVELMGGRIWVRSKLNEGSTFSFIIPAV